MSRFCPVEAGYSLEVLEKFFDIEHLYVLFSQTITMSSAKSTMSATEKNTVHSEKELIRQSRRFYIATVGVLAPDYRYYIVSKIPYDVMRLAWRDRVLGMLLAEAFISEKYATKLKKRYPALI